MAPEKLPLQAHTCSHEADFGTINTAIRGIQETLSSMKELLTSNAALEVQATQFRRELSSLTTRIHTIELEHAASKGSSKWVDKVVWFLLSAGLGALLTLKLSF